MAPKKQGGWGLLRTAQKIARRVPPNNDVKAKAAGATPTGSSVPPSSSGGGTPEAQERAPAKTPEEDARAAEEAYERKLAQAKVLMRDFVRAWKARRMIRLLLEEKSRQLQEEKNALLAEVEALRERKAAEDKESAQQRSEIQALRREALQYQTLDEFRRQVEAEVEETVREERQNHERWCSFLRQTALKEMEDDRRRREQLQRTQVRGLEERCQRHSALLRREASELKEEFLRVQGDFCTALGIEPPPPALPPRKDGIDKRLSHRLSARGGGSRNSSKSMTRSMTEQLTTRLRSMTEQLTPRRGAASSRASSPRPAALVVPSLSEMPRSSGSSPRPPHSPLLAKRSTWSEEAPQSPREVSSTRSHKKLTVHFQPGQRLLDSPPEGRARAFTSSA
eukprot:TRINITY_DN25332_c0_g1_i1.p1 TRINITY_DN25332_c0_g1~~TRINITY_DN25332_c0_g1_i1.p1  ORF type:complete len:395 (-),score=98.37 TRINITY_DN25332_c0_g1_i1:230-1414(-)